MKGNISSLVELAEIVEKNEQQKQDYLVSTEKMEMLSDKNLQIAEEGIANGITALAHEIENPDQQYQYERIGNDVIELSTKEWEVLSA